MQSASFNSVKSVLCLGSHPDDIEIGCGGTLRKMFSDSTEVHWIVFSGSEVRRKEAELSAQAWLSGFKNSRIELLDFEDGFFPVSLEAIKRYFASLRSNFNPDLIFTHCLNDRHQDHRVISELTWQTFRDHMILEYEIPKFEGDLGHPGVFIPLEEEELNAKIDDLIRFHQSQTAKPWFDRDLFRGHSRLRGAKCNCRFAEAFHARKLVFK